MSRQIAFEEIPKEWGLLVPRSGKHRNVRDTDLKLLRLLRNECRDEYYGKPVPYKWVLRKFMCRGALDRLWGAGFVEKFAVSEHTQSGRPNYTSWYIWEDLPRIRNNSSVPQFIVGS